jgi:hypothetical protein
MLLILLTATHVTQRHTKPKCCVSLATHPIFAFVLLTATDVVQQCVHFSTVHRIVEQKALVCSHDDAFSIYVYAKASECDVITTATRATAPGKQTVPPGSDVMRTGTGAVQGTGRLQQECVWTLVERREKELEGPRTGRSGISTARERHDGAAVRGVEECGCVQSVTRCDQ